MVNEEPPILAVPQAVADLLPDEQTVWDSYQRFLHAIVFPGPLSYDGYTITAALLTLATASIQKPNPVHAETRDETQGFSSRD